MSGNTYMYILNTFEEMLLVLCLGFDDDGNFTHDCGTLKCENAAICEKVAKCEKNSTLNVRN